MDAKFSDNVKEIMGKRGLKEADIVDVINTAESSNRKLVKNGINLAKKRIGEVTMYALYNDDGEVQSTYSHRMVLGDPIKTTDEPDLTEWVCKECNETAEVGSADMTYLGVTRTGPAVICPKCNDVWIEEYLAVQTIAAAEGLFEQKKA
ncbi:MAG: hypothetical protein GX369_02665 [Euryarchaeota archaeon]|nr:hypothetical protein [Euryarchaeota archaeon]